MKKMVDADIAVLIIGALFAEHCLKVANIDPLPRALCSSFIFCLI